MIRTLFLHSSGTVMELADTQLADAIKDSQAKLWIDMLDPTLDEYHLVLNDLFRFHPLAVEDAIQDSHVPKLDDYRNYLFLVAHTIHLGDEKMDLDTHELDVFLGNNYLITMHDVPMKSIDRLWEPTHHQERGLGRGPAMLLYELLDRQVDTYTPLLDQFENRLENLGDLIFQSNLAHGPEQQLLDEILTAKSTALRMRRILGPQRDLLNRLAREDYNVIPARSRIYFRDVYDHVVRTADLADSMRDLASSTMDTHLTLVNNRMNEIMKVLTIISTIFIPLSFLAGVYGMNFVFMPELNQPWTYPLLWVVFLGIGGGMLWMFRRRGWL
jgi:magnesium transporter